MSRFVILHNVRSAHNVGSIFRTADGAGVSKIYLTGYTPAPTDRFGREHPEIKKTSLGASVFVPWEQYESLDVCLTGLKRDNVTIVAIEQHERAVSYRTYTEVGDTAYLFGNEVDGVPGSACVTVDTVLMIPMHGQKESLNVSVAAGIILFRVCADN